MKIEIPIRIEAQNFLATMKQDGVFTSEIIMFLCCELDDKLSKELQAALNKHIIENE